MTGMTRTFTAGHRVLIRRTRTETDLRCLRSGSFHSVPAVSRSSQRARWVGPKQVRYNYGLRVVVSTEVNAKDNLKSHFKPIIEKFGKHSTTKIKVVSGPEAVQMRNGRVAGKQWIATSGDYQFKLTIEDATGAKLEKLVGRLEKLPSSYLSACVAVSDKGRRRDRDLCGPRWSKSAWRKRIY